MNFGITASSYVDSGGGGGGSAYANEVLADNPLLYWRLNETSGTVVVDSSGNGRNGTYVNSPALNQRGLVQADADTCVHFEFVNNSHATLASSSWMNIASMTITAICRVTLSGLQMIASRYHDPNNDRSWFLYAQGGEFKFYVRGSDGGETIVSSGVTATVGSEYYVAAYSDAGGVGIRVYDYTGLLGSATGTGRAVNGSTRSFKVACSDDGTGYYQAEAYIDELAFYSSVLSTSRLDALASVAMTPQPQWLNRASGVSPRNGTVNHTITFPATSAGSFMAVILNAADTFSIVTAGWTTRLSPINGTQLTLCTRSVNAGETTLQVDTSVANVALNYVVYEFPGGTSYHSGVDANGGVWPTLTGLPADPSITLFGVWGSYCHDPSNPLQSAVWNFGWKEDFDLMTPDDGTTNGVYTTVGYKDLYVAPTGGAAWSSDFYVSNNFNVAQIMVFALTVP